MPELSFQSAHGQWRCMRRHVAQTYGQAALKAATLAVTLRGHWFRHPDFSDCDAVTCNPTSLSAAQLKKACDIMHISKTGIPIGEC